MPEPTNDAVSDERLREIAENYGYGRAEAQAIAAELLTRRSVTSQASEGVAEPFNTGVGWENLSCDDQFALARKIAANVGYVLVAEPLISKTEDRAEAMMLREALLDADEHLTGIENYGGEPAVRARRGRASIEAALAYASPSKRVERLETALKECAAPFHRGDGGPNLIPFHDLSNEFGRRQSIARQALGDRS